jgi:cyclo(L-tyrosyl-L-tyrosyl) synthase
MNNAQGDNNLDNMHVQVAPYLISSLSKEIYSKKEHVLLGISPFNSYFSEEVISHWVRWAEHNFSSFNIFVPDTLPIYTFLALGYNEAKSINKAKRQALYLKNKIFRTLANANFNEFEASKLLIDMNFLQKNEFYNSLKERCYKLYRENIEFQNECNKSTGWVLSGQISKDLNKGNQNIAVRYLLDEMPLFINTPLILKVPSSLFSYHQIPEFINYLYTDHCNNNFIDLNQGFMRLSVTYKETISTGI